MFLRPERKALLESMLNQQLITFNLLRHNLLCNWFIIKNPKQQHPFPYCGNGGMLGGFLGVSDEILSGNSNSFIKLSPEEVSELDRERNKKVNLLDGDEVFFWNIDVKNKKSFEEIFEHFFLMELLCKKYISDLKSKDPACRVSGLRTMDNLWWLSIDLMQKYFELIGYWTAKMEGKAQRRDSGKGQKDAKEKRQNDVTEAIKKFVNDIDKKDVLHIDKALFNEVLCKAFVGAEEYPRSPNTISSYKEAVERNLGKKIVLQKGTILKQKGSVM